MTFHRWLSIFSVILLVPSLVFAETDDIQKGIESLEKGDTTLAIKFFSSAIQKDRNNTKPYFLRAEVYRATKDYDRAIRDLTALIRIDPKDIDAYIWRGNTYSDKKDYDRAIKDYNEAIRLKPTEAIPYHNRGSAYYAKEDYDTAIKDFSEAIRLDPNSDLGYNNRGNAHKAKRDYDKAIEDYSEAIRLDPKGSTRYFNRGSAYVAKKDYDRAIEDLSEAIRLRPKFAHALNYLAWLWATCPKAKVRNGQKAIEYARKACTLTKWKDSDMLGTLAAAYAENGDFGEAVKWQKQGLKLGYDDKEHEAKARKLLKLYEQKKPYRDE